MGKGRRIVAGVVIAAVAVLGAARGSRLEAQERWTLTSPVAREAQSTIQLTTVHIDIVNKAVTVTWVDNTGEAGRAYYPTPAPAGSSQPSGAMLLSTLNTANLSNNSLVKRVLTRLAADGYVGAGAVSGTPE
jgi:hypothetical protein